MRPETPSTSGMLVSVKDDLYTITGAELKKCGYRVLKLDLRNVFCSCHFNLLYRVNIEIDAWRKERDAKRRAVHYATAERYAKVIASAIIGNTGSVNSGDSSEYFNETARGLITGLVLLVSQYGQDGERHIVSVFNLIVELAGADNPEKGNTVQKSRLAAMLEGVTDRRIKILVPCSPGAGCHRRERLSGNQVTQHGISASGAGKCPGTPPHAPGSNQGAAPQAGGFPARSGSTVPRKIQPLNNNNAPGKRIAWG